MPVDTQDRRGWAMNSRCPCVVGTIAARVQWACPLKFICGLVHKHTVTSGGQTFLYRVPKSTSFDDMTPDEWAAYWPRVLDAVHQRVLPTVGSEFLMEELQRLAS